MGGVFSRISFWVEMFVPRALVVKSAPPAKRQRVQHHIRLSDSTSPLRELHRPRDDDEETTQSPQLLDPVQVASDDANNNTDNNTPPPDSPADTPAADAVNDVVEFSANQRMPEPDEPVCCVCGRYGAYICDETDADVCSRECKKIHLSQININDAITISNSNAAAAHLNDDSTPLQYATHSPEPRKYEHDEIFDDEQDANLLGGVLVSDGPVFDLYREHPDITALSDAQIFRIMKQLHITARGSNVPKPILSFEHCRNSLPNCVLRNLELFEYSVPTHIQMQLIPLAMSGRDVLATAPTGSGKTCAFVLPAIAYCIANRIRVGLAGAPLSLILCPTRELGIQIEIQVKQLAHGTNLRTALVVGGLSAPPQMHRLCQGSEIVVGTPGRLQECIIRLRPKWTLEHTHFLVLDEVDMMLKMGFREQVNLIVARLPEHRQLLLLSATVPSSIEAFVGDLLKNPVFVTVGHLNNAAEAVHQLVLWVETKNKKKKLFEILNSSAHFKPPCIVFVASKLGAELLAGTITTVTGLEATAIHGDLAQSERMAAIEKFVEGSVNILVATGVLGRGIDLVRVNQVICFDMPKAVSEYIHQIGRAGRLGAQGSAILFINLEDRGTFGSLIELLNRSKNKAPLPHQLVKFKNAPLRSASRIRPRLKRQK
eukprot:c10117_g1_i1.p1 GENE.c10117_g1_i1~~c10117_g1_i1.p1  ORF type:complete len:657 (+),score=143.83 c10117_g1_i1:1-1971(+)